MYLNVRRCLDCFDEPVCSDREVSITRVAKLVGIEFCFAFPPVIGFTARVVERRDLSRSRRLRSLGSQGLNPGGRYPRGEGM